MSLFQEAQCLRCGSALPLRVLWDFARVNDKHVLPGLNLLTRSGFLRGKIGITCPNCGATFRVVQTRTRIAYALVWAAFLFGAAYLLRALPHSVPADQLQPLRVAVLIAGSTAALVLLRILTPRLAMVRPPEEGEKLIFPLRSAYEPPKA